MKYNVVRTIFFAQQLRKYQQKLYLVSYFRTPGTLRAPLCAGPGSDPIGGDTPPPVLTQVGHVCHMEGAQWKAPGHGNV